MDKPQRALTLQLKIEADDLDEMERMLDHIIFEARGGEYTPNSVSGGVGSGGWWGWKVKAITHDEYIKHLNEYLKLEREGKLDGRATQ
jgi:hypothetical protein